MKQNKITCTSCKKVIGNKQGDYCPYCGKKHQKPLYAIGMKDIVERLLTSIQTKLMKKLFLTLKDSISQENTKSKRGFNVKITTGKNPSLTHTNQSTMTKKETDMTISKKRPVPTETIEPKTDITRMPDKLKINISLPDIDRMDDIDIFEFENSSEIRAYSGETLYFKIIEIPNDLILSGKKLANNTLFLEFTK